MNDRRFRIGYFMASAAFLILLGTLCHFVNEWDGNYFLTTWFAPVNESIWEHLKLLFFPGLLLMGLTFWLAKRHRRGYCTAQGLGILAGLLWITAAYYTYHGITGKEWMWMDILIFVLGCLLSQWITLICWNPEKMQNTTGKVMVWVLLGVLTAMFICFTYAPPKLPFFVDPQTGQYGI